MIQIGKSSSQWGGGEIDMSDGEPGGVWKKSVDVQ